MKKIYAPNPEKPQTMGEVWFLQCKFWKLYVMCGIDWKHDTWTKRGFSYFKLNYDSYLKRLEWLDANGIVYKTEMSEAGWQYRIILSGRKSNVEKVDALYREYEQSLKEEAEANSYIWFENWYYDAEAWEDRENKLAELRKRFKNI